MEVFVKETVWLKRDILDFGWGNGYVCIPKSSKLHGKTYFEIAEMIPELKVNGGLTFSKPAGVLGSWDELPDGCEDCWVVGFDTCHSWDKLEHWGKTEVIIEAHKLREQLEEFDRQG